MEESMIFSIIALVLSFIALIISLWQAIIAKKTYKIEYSRHKDEKPDFSVINATLPTAVIKLDGNVIIKFFIIVFNKSSNDMSIKDIRLKMTNEKSVVVFEPNFGDDLLFLGENIKAKSSIKKWVEFEIEKKIYDLDIKKFVVEFIDTFDNKREIVSIHFNEEVEQDEEKRKS